MENGIKIRDGLRSRRTYDVEEGLQQQQDDDDESSFLFYDADDDDGVDDDGNSSDEENYHGNSKSHSRCYCHSCCMTIAQRIPIISAPIQQAIIRCEQTQQYYQQQKCCFCNNSNNGRQSSRKGRKRKSHCNYHYLNKQNYFSSCFCIRQSLSRQTLPEFQRQNQSTNNSSMDCCRILYHRLFRYFYITPSTAVTADATVLPSPSIAMSRTSIPATIPLSDPLVDSITKESFRSLYTKETDDETPEEDFEWTPLSAATADAAIITLPQTPKFINYSKCRAELPEIPPIQIDFVPNKMLEKLSDKENTEISLPLEEDLLLSSQGQPSEERCIYRLRLPKKKRKEPQRRAPVRTFSNSSGASLQAMARHSNSGDSKGSLREMLRRTNSKEGLIGLFRTNSRGSIHGVRRGSGDTAKQNAKWNAPSAPSTSAATAAASAATNPMARSVFVAPFPKPLSRENSMECLMDLDKTRTPQQTPLHRKQTLKSSDIRSFMMASPSIRSDNESFSDFAEEITISLNDVSDLSLRYPSTNNIVHSDEEIDPEVLARRKLRMQRRSSFVAGSKIERFDRNDTQSRTRRALNRRAAAKNGESYAEWKIDLMVNG